MSLDQLDVPITLEVSLLKKHLSTTESPYTWISDILENIDPKNLIKKYIKELEDWQDDPNDDEPAFKYLKFLLHLLLCYEYSRIKDLKSAEKHLEQGENMLNLLNQEHYLWTCKKALLHILTSSKSYLMLYKNKIKRAIKLFNSITKKENLDKDNQAGLWGIKAIYIYINGDVYLKRSLEYIIKAQKLDPHQIHWVFYEGRIRRSIRKKYDPHAIPCNEEFTKLREAYKAKSYDSSYAYHYASNLVDKALKLSPPESDFLYREAEEISKNLLKKRPNIERILKNSAKILLRTPYKRNHSLAREYLEKVLNQKPSDVSALFNMAYYYEIKVKDNEKAANYYKKAADNDCFQAWIRYFACQYKLNNKYNPINDLNELLLIANNAQKQKEIYLELGWFYFIKEREIKKALENWIKILDLDNGCDIILNSSSKPRIIKIRKSYNLSEIIFDEIDKIIKHGQVDTVKELSSFENAKDLLLAANKDFYNRKPLSWMNELQTEVWKTQSKENSTSNSQKFHWSFKQEKRLCYNEKNDEKKSWRDEMKSSPIEKQVVESWRDEMKSSPVEKQVVESWRDEMKSSPVEKQVVENQENKQ